MVVLEEEEEAWAVGSVSVVRRRSSVLLLLRRCIVGGEDWNLVRFHAFGKEDEDEEGIFLPVCNDLVVYCRHSLSLSLSLQQSNMCLASKLVRSHPHGAC